MKKVCKVSLVCTDTLRSAKIAIDKKLSKLSPTDLDAQNFVIVPDRSTLDAEKALLKTLGGSFNTQVVTFKNLANRLVSTSLNYLNKQNGVLLLSRLAFDNADKLVCFSKSFATDGFAEKLYELISAFKYSRINPQALTTNDLPMALKNKLQDVQTLYSLYVQETQNSFVDSADTLELLFDCLNEQTIGNWRFFVYDFLSFTEQEKAIVEKLILKAKEVVVATPSSLGVEKKSHLYDNAVATAVKTICQKNDVDLAIEYFVAPTSKISKNLYDVFFGDDKQQNLCCDGKIILREEPDNVAEAKSLARFVDAYVKAGGVYSDVKVVCSDVEQYSYAIFNSFADYDVPVYVDQKTSLERTLPAQYLLSFLHSHEVGHQLDAVLAFGKNPLFEENLCAFETFCKKYNVNFFYDKFDIGSQDDLFLDADATREKIQGYLCGVQVPKVATASQYVDLLQEVVKEQALEQKIVEFVEKLRLYSQEREANVQEQSLKKILGVFEQIKVIFGETPISLSRFLVGLTSSLASQTISVLPTKADCVFVSNLDKGKNHDVKVLAVLGANEGELPKLYKSCALLSDKNLAQLSLRGLSVDISLEQKNKQERFSLCNLLCEPQDLLYVSYKTKVKREELRPSYLVTTLKKAFGLKENTVASFAESAKTILAQAIRAQGNINDGVPLTAEQRVCFDLCGEQAKAYDVFKSSVDNISNGAELFFKDDNFSVTSIEKFFECPTWHFFNNGLKLKELQVADLKSSDFGDILHSVFQTFVNKIIAGKTADEEVAKNIFDEIMQKEKYQAILKTFKGKAFCAKLKNEAVWHCLQIKKEIQNSKFVPFATEFVFGKKSGKAPQLVVNGKTLYLKGIADRIDVCGDMALIYDYKSGSPTFSVAQLYNGTKLQLFVYALAVKKALGKTPVGSVYYKVKNPENTDKKSKIIGRVVSDVNILKQIDGTLDAGVAGDLLGSCVTKKGEINKKFTTYVDKNIFEDYQTYAEKIIKKACQLMADGYVDVNPLKDACKFCPAKQICGFNDTRIKPARSKITLSDEDVSALAKEQTNG